MVSIIHEILDGKNCLQLRECISESEITFLYHNQVVFLENLALWSELKFDPTDNLSRRHWYQNVAFLVPFNFYKGHIFGY